MLKPHSLKNKLTLIKRPNTNSNLFTIGFVINSGYAYEGESFPLGSSKLVERLFWSGTDKNPSRRHLNRTLESIGGKFYSFTTAEYIELYIVVPSQNQYKAVSMMAEIIQHSLFDPKDIELEKEMLSDYFKNVDSLTGLRLGLGNIYEEYGYSNSSKGYLEELFKINKKSVQNYLDTQVTPTNCSLVLSGNFSSKEITAMIEQEWSFWNPNLKESLRLKKLMSHEIREKLPKVMFLQRGLPETEIVCGFLFDKGLYQFDYENTEDNTGGHDAVKEKFSKTYAELLLLNAILGGGLSSRLWQKGVEEDMVFENVLSEIVWFSQTGYMHIYGKTDNDQFTFGLESMLVNVASLIKNAVTVNELAKAKEYLKGQLIIENEDLLSSTIWHTETYLSSKLSIEISEIINLIDTVEARDIRNIATEIFRKDRFFLTTLGTSKETLLIDKLVNKYLG